jgi:para-aminobenzoate synthetase component 1
MNTSTTTKSARSNVWRKFLELRSRGAILFDTAYGRSFVCVPSLVMPARFSGEGMWVGILPYSGEPIWKYCEEVHEFFVEVEDGAQFGEFKISNFASTISRDEYVRKIGEIKKYLRDGDSYQVNFAQEFLADFKGDAFALYTAMFALNPTAMSFYFEEGGLAICSNSPERLFSLRDGILRAEPIKGTVGASEDPAFLLNDEKSQAELSMIVDLLRNDLARVGKNVRVVKHQEIMKLANVFHTFSIIEADLREGVGPQEILDAVFPGGSVTGCPKIRTMEIIDRLENFKRGFYCGSAGYFWRGEADFNIIIRTATIRGEKLSFPAGGGILIDSDAAMEYDETLQKAAVIRHFTDEL